MLSYPNSESMYNTNYVTSGLITGTQWDVMLNKLIEKTDLTEVDIKSSGKWGNYRDNAIDYNGRKARISFSDYGYIEPFGERKEEKTTNYGTKGIGRILWGFINNRLEWLY